MKTAGVIAAQVRKNTSRLFAVPTGEGVSDDETTLKVDPVAAAIARARVDAHRRELGKLVRSFQKHSGARAALSIFIALVLGALVIAASVEADLLTARAGLAAVATIAWIAAACGLLALRDPLRVLIHEGGIVAVRGTAQAAMYYGDILQIQRVERRHAFAALGFGPHLVLRITARKRPAIEIAGRGARFRAAVDEIMELAMRVVAPRCAADFYAGEEVGFGSIRLSRRGLSMTEPSGKRIEVPIGDVGAFKIDRGVLTIARRSNGKRVGAIRLADITNLPALEMLLQRVCSGTKASTADRRGGLS
jgi:hypothetical protein